MNELHDYTDILHMEHPVSKKHPPMPRENRAAQFAPFAALTGHKEMVEETQRLTEQKRCLDEHQKELLDQELQIILSHRKEHPFVNVCYFVKDEQKEGGCYMTMIKQLKKMDEVYHKLTFFDHTVIELDDIYRIEYLEDYENKEN